MLTGIPLSFEIILLHCQGGVQGDTTQSTQTKSTQITATEHEHKGSDMQHTRSSTEAVEWTTSDDAILCVTNIQLKINDI